MIHFIPFLFIFFNHSIPSSILLLHTKYNLCFKVSPLIKPKGTSYKLTKIYPFYSRVVALEPVAELAQKLRGIPLNFFFSYVHTIIIINTDTYIKDLSPSFFHSLKSNHHIFVRYFIKYFFFNRTNQSPVQKAVTHSIT